jgi:hypothetical protein
MVMMAGVKPQGLALFTVKVRVTKLAKKNQIDRSTLLSGIGTYRKNRLGYPTECKTWSSQSTSDEYGVA